MGNTASEDFPRPPLSDGLNMRSPSCHLPHNGYRECLANGSWAARVNYSECQEILNEEKLQIALIKLQRPRVLQIMDSQKSACEMGLVRAPQGRVPQEICPKPAPPGTGPQVGSLLHAWLARGWH
ncbi:hypothetical protein P7K49_010702 [Saguinus oedipus]|uniref:Uncharacterized protein n=1 Tax=Saguinus oedipus TaxID=9490 RepID=A0ABQ9VNJ7_SAGOE|nr:hypothetical protein P7K49_010702 [Saguinus oedipus]